jgi:ABC-type sugar transport system substrate-binding protein
MRRLHGLLVIFLAGGLLLLGSTAFASGQSEGKGGAQKVTVGFSSPSLIGGQLDIQNSLVDPAQKMGWEVVTTNANGDPAKQLSDIQYFISLGVQAIVATPQDSAGICTAVEKANQAHIPFFTIDRGTSGCKVAMTVESNNVQGGQQAAESVVSYLKQKYNGQVKGKVLEITGDLGQNVGVQRRDGFDNVLKQYPNVQLIEKVGNWDAAKGEQAVLDVASANTDLDAIYLASDAVYVSGTESALKQAGMLHKRGEAGHVFICAVDGSPIGLQAIREGWADMCSGQPVNDFGSVVLKYIPQVLKGQAVQPGTVTQEGALWSPAIISINSDGTPVLDLSTAKVTIANVDNPHLWGNASANK